MLPVALTSPITLAPMPVTVNTLALPAALILTLPFTTGMLRLLVPLLITETIDDVQLSPPDPLVVKN